MKIRLFGKTSDDKGAQLEKLTQRLLARLGYRQITLNFVGSGGSEIDIRAEYPMPSLAGDKLVHLIGKCKAYEATVGLPDWLKFLGKLYMERTCKRKEISGLFVALSGVNGNVAGAYDDLRNHDESVDLISGDNLVAQLLEEFKLPGVSHFLQRIGHGTTDPVATVSLGYYEGRVFWIAEFVNSTFTMLTGELLDQVPTPEVIELVSAQIQAARYRDLSQEQMAKDRLALARKHVLGQLLIHRSIDPPPQEELSGAGLPIFLQGDINRACAELQEEGKIIREEASLRLAGTTDVRFRAAIIREIISGICNFSHLATPEWEALIDDELLGESLRIKDGLVIEGPDLRAELTQLMTWSPRALLWALGPDDLLCGHRREVPAVEELMTRVHVKYYRTQLLTYAIEDFRVTSFGRILHERYGLRELEFARRGVFKSEKGVELEMDVTERIALARYDAATGGGIGQVLLVDHAPEPWSRGMPRAGNLDAGSSQDSARGLNDGSTA
jgi:Restriction endonuclease